MAKGYLWINIALLISLVSLTGCGPTAFRIELVPSRQQLEETEIQRHEGVVIRDKIAVIDVDGLLINRRKHGWMQEGDNPVSLFVEKLDKAASDRNVKAVVLRDRKSTRLNSSHGYIS